MAKNILCPIDKSFCHNGLTISKNGNVETLCGMYSEELHVCRFIQTFEHLNMLIKIFDQLAKK
jgi:hypothetical protein